MLQEYDNFGDKIISEISKSVSILGLVGIFSDWSSFVEDIFLFMQQSILYLYKKYNTI